MFRYAKKLSLGISGLAIGLCASGCGYAYKSNSKQLNEQFSRGQYAAAAEQCIKVAESAPNSSTDKNHLLAYRLEVATTCFAAGRYAEGIAALDSAEDMFEARDRTAKSTAVGNEVAATLLNPMAVEYAGRGHERIMVNTYLLLGRMYSGDHEGARVSVEQAKSAQALNEFHFRRQLDADQKLEQENKGSSESVDVARVTSDPKFGEGRSKLLADFPDVDKEPALDKERYRELWVNPFAEYVQGIYYTHSKVAGDPEQGRVCFENAVKMMPDENRYVALDMAHASAAARQKLTPRVYVLFETGMAPYRDEVRIDLPIFLVSMQTRNDIKVDYVGVAFPVLKQQKGAYDFLTVSTSTERLNTKTLADFDRIIAREFKAELPSIITRTVVSAVAKAAAQYGVAKAVEGQNAWVQIIARLSMALSQAALNEADVRGWHTLPKKAQAISLAPPSNGKLDLAMQQGAPFTSVVVPTNRSSIVWVRSPSTAAQATVQVFPIN